MFSCFLCFPLVFWFYTAFSSLFCCFYLGYVSLVFLFHWFSYISLYIMVFSCIGFCSLSSLFSVATYMLGACCCCCWWWWWWQEAKKPKAKRPRSHRSHRSHKPKSQEAKSQEAKKPRSQEAKSQEAKSQEARNPGKQKKIQKKNKKSQIKYPSNCKSPLGRSTFSCHRLLHIQLNSANASTDFRTVSPELPFWEFEHLNKLFETPVYND